MVGNGSNNRTLYFGGIGKNRLTIKQLIMDGAIIPLTDLTNRAQKRRFVRESEKIAGKLEEVNTTFIWHLFNAENSMTYKEIYVYYLNQWTATVDALVNSKQFTHVAIDILFFEREYKPKFYIK